MASQKERRPTSGTYSQDGGKYYFLVTATFTTSKISYKMQVIITDALKSKHTFKVKSAWTTTSVKAKGKGTYTFGTDEIMDAQYVPAIDFYVDGKKKATVKNKTIKYDSAAPKSPSKISVDLINDARIDIVVEGSQYATVPTNKIDIERCKDVMDTNAYTPIPSSPFSVSEDTSEPYILTKSDQSADIERGHRYRFRARAKNTMSGKDSTWIYSDVIYTTAANDGSTGDTVAQRISNNEVSVSWSISSVQYVNNKLVTRFLIFRSDNDGAFKQIGSVDADTAHTQYEYTDRTCTPDNTYRYAVKFDGSGSEAETMTGASEIIYMTPARPQGISAAHDSSGNVVVTIKNESKTATHVCIERRLDGGSWAQIAEEDYAAGGQTYVDDSATAEDTIEYRARNRCDQLTGASAYSDYVSSMSVIEKAPPNPPTLRSPISGSAILLDEGRIRMVWQHNATDGSSQEQAQLRHKKNDGAWTTVSLTDDSYYQLNIDSGYSAGDVISWQVRTRGAYTGDPNGGFSEWSEAATVSILTKPVLTFTSPDNGEVITTLPVDLSWAYSDQSGTLQSLTVDIKKESTLVKTFDVPVGDGASGPYSYSLAGFLFENDTVYGITATALSSSGFTSVSDIAVSIAYDEVSLDGGLIPTSQFDEDGVATIVIERDITPDEETGEVPDPIDIAEAYLYRVHDRERTLVAAGVSEGTQIEDKYAPINVAYSYELLMLTQDGKVSIVTIDVTQRSRYWFVYWGKNSIARAEWNPEGSVDLKRPEKTQVRYSGRKYAVSYDSSAIDETFAFSWETFEREELDNFRQMIRDGGRGIWKSGDGDVYDADFELKYSASYKSSLRVWKCTLSVTRIDGES